MEKFETMRQRKHEKYKKMLKKYLIRLDKIVKNVPKSVSQFENSECLANFKIHFLDEQSMKDISENMNLRKSQLFLKMFLYWFREFHHELK